jgi:hypothetical protein
MQIIAMPPFLPRRAARVHGKYLEHSGGGEANEVGTKTEAGTGAGAASHGGGKKVKDGEHEGSHNGNYEDLLDRGNLAGDDYHGNGHGKTLEEVLDHTVKEFVGGHL